MILISTHTKLVKSNASIFRVDYPVMDAVKLGLSDTASISASHEHFATKAQAIATVNRYAPFCVGAISVVPASAFNPWTDI